MKMLCDECKVNEATCAVTMLAGNRTVTRHLCRSCMESIQKTNPRDALARILHETLKNTILSAQEEKTASDAAREKQRMQREEEEKNDDVRCPVCGRTYGEVRKKKQLGCAACGEAFREYLPEYIANMPQNKAVAGSKEKNHCGSLPDDEAFSIRTSYKIREMSIMLEKAVQEENYESAARLRDAINQERQNMGL